ncbi:MAG: hypothetical protein KF752_07210 [Pirellulaceae bacterium]|nr:hypothetical protein [Pirellulaceae bacterium]
MNRQQALDVSVALLRKRNELVQRIAEGRRQWDAGGFVEFDDESLLEYLIQLKSRSKGKSSL